MLRLQSDKAQTASIQIKTLSDNTEVLKEFSNVVSSMYGPKGRASMLQNTSGGNLTLTSSSRSLLGALSIRRSIIKLVTSACQGHLAVYQDGGLFLMRLTMELILGGLELNMNPIALSDVFELFLTIIMEYLDSPNCGLKIPACMSDLNFMKSFVNSILGSKPVCQMSDGNLKHISRLLIECFLSGIGDNELTCTENVFIKTEEGCDISESFTKNGILLEAPELSRFKEKVVKLKYCDNGGSDMIKVALVTISMSGDMGEMSGVKYNVSDDVDLNDTVLENLNEFCDILIGQEVGLVLCQKVVHPELKYRLRENGLLVVDRIGYQPIIFIKTLTGAQSIQCLEPSTSVQGMLGWVDYVSHTIVHRKSYILLTRKGCTVTTLYLCHQIEQHLNELKDVYNSALVSLRHLLYGPYVLPGAGCWQSKLALYLAKQVKAKSKYFCKEIGCTESMLTEACSVFMKSLVQSGTSQSTKYLINCRNGHVYENLMGDGLNIITCCSRLELNDHSNKFLEVRKSDFHEYLQKEEVDFENEREITKEELLDVLRSREVIMDSLSTCKSALQNAILTAVSALRIGQVIEDIS